MNDNMDMQSQRRLSKLNHHNAIAMSLSGLAVGWMVGLSVSPVVEKVITSVLGLMISVLGALAGLKATTESVHNGDESVAPKEHTPDLPAVASPIYASKSEWASESLGRLQVNLVPLAVFTVLLAVGTTMGTLARINLLLGIRPSWVAKRFVIPQGASADTQHSSNNIDDTSRDRCLKALDESCVYSRILDNSYPPRSDSTEKPLRSDNAEEKPPHGKEPEQPVAKSALTPPQLPIAAIGAGPIGNTPRREQQCNEISNFIATKEFEAAFNAISTHAGHPPSCGKTEKCLKQEARKLGCSGI